MKCLRCGNTTSKVIETTKYETCVIRFRKCKHCNRVEETIETCDDFMEQEINSTAVSSNCVDKGWVGTVPYVSNRGTAFVYFVQSISGGLIKIGWSIEPSRRLKSLQTGSPTILKIIGCLPLSYQEKEREVHALMKKFKVRDEWHEPSTELLNFIKNNCSSEGMEYEMPKM